MRSTMVLVLLGSFTCVTADEGAKGQDEGLKALQGRWKLVGYERDGKKSVPAEDAVLVIDGGTRIASSGKVRQPGQLRVDSSQNLFRKILRDKLVS